MTSKITTLPPVSKATVTKTIFANENFKCSLVSLAPGEEIPGRELNAREDQLLFVIEGEITVRLGEVNTILGRDQAVFIRQGPEYVITGPLEKWAKVLRVEIPPREIVTPEILTLGH